jgi:hypothetical protein
MDENGRKGRQRRQTDPAVHPLATTTFTMFDMPPDPTDGRFGTDPPDTAPLVTPDTAFAALTDSRRRTVLAALREHGDDPVGVETLADRVVSREAPSTSTRRHVHMSVVNVALPKLHDWGLVEYDSARKTVRYVASPLVEGLLAQITGRDDR